MVQIYHVNAMDMLHRDIGLFDAVITDPPYSLGGATLTDKQRGTAQKYTNTKQHCPFPDFVGDAMDQRSWTRMMREVLSAARDHCRPGAILAVFIDWRNLPSLYDAIQWAGLALRGRRRSVIGRLTRANACVWPSVASARPCAGGWPDSGMGQTDIAPAAGTLPATDRVLGLGQQRPAAA